MINKTCPMHTLDEEVTVEKVSDEVGWKLTCSLLHPPNSGPYSWLAAPEPPSGPGLSEVAEQYNLGTELPAALKSVGGGWVEYGIVERAYALQCSSDWRELVDRYGHRALHEGSKYTVSAFLAGSLGHLDRAGAVMGRFGKATGVWAPNGTVSYWALAPEPDWEQRTTVDDGGASMSYVTGTE